MSVFYQAAVAFIAFLGMVVTIYKIVDSKFDRVYDKMEHKIDDYAKETRKAHEGIGKRIDGVRGEIAGLRGEVGYLKGRIVELGGRSTMSKEDV